MKVVVSLENPGYWETKAIELIKEAQEEIKTNPNKIADYNEKIQQAISLLALSKAYRNEDPNKR